jgi:hypothetical protein
MPMAPFPGVNVSLMFQFLDLTGLTNILEIVELLVGGTHKVRVFFLILLLSAAHGDLF